MENLKTVGSFQVTNGKLYISDPCYSRGRDDLCATVQNVANGKWFGKVEYNNEGRVAVLIAEHEDLEHDICGTYEIEDLAVDSGQMGIYAEDKFPNSQEEMGKYGDTSKHYGKCCKETQSKARAGIVDNYGVVSSSGYGDGGYDAAVTRDVNGLARFVGVYFILEDDESDEDESEMN